ncbi:MAG: hypothetical protein PHE21_00890 [Candidatus Dojkabacteria bacterium]|nr:hypothetical protein [Candidatus Dojkabacteria bacterium]
MKENKYKPVDRDGGFPKDMPYLKRRIFEIIPGLFVWILLLLPFIFALTRWEEGLAIYVAFLVAYWSIRNLKFTVGVFIGIRRMKRDLATDWMKKIKETNEEKFNELRYVYLCPVYSESLEILKPSFEAWSKSDVGAEKIDVVVAMEEKKKDLQLENYEKLKEMYGDKFGSMTYYIHPAGIEGEVAGVKGANINWASRHYVEKLEKEGKDISNYLLITCDSDLRPHPKYLSAVTYKYLTVDEPDNRFYATAIHTFNNNIWSVPSMIRTQSNMLSLVQIQNWVVDKYKKLPFSNEKIFTRDTFSSYIVNLATLKKYQYWDPEIANDDTAFFWNALMRSGGSFKSQEVYIPTYNDAVENETYFKSHVSFYKQQYRWGWGIFTYPISLAAMSKSNNKKFPAIKKFYLIKVMLEYLWLLTLVFFLTFGLLIMGAFNPDFQFTGIAYYLPRILSYVFTVITVLNVSVIFYRRQITPVPKDWKWWRHVVDIAETFLIAINMLTFSFIPYIQAMTEMMFGLGKFKRNFYVTEKVKIKK